MRIFFHLKKDFGVGLYKYKYIAQQLFFPELTQMFQKKILNTLTHLYCALSFPIKSKYAILEITKYVFVLLRNDTNEKYVLKPLRVYTEHYRSAQLTHKSRSENKSLWY